MRSLHRRSTRRATVLLAAWLLLGDAGPVEAGPPTDALKDFFGAVNVTLTDPRTEDQPLARLRAIRRHVDDMLDVREAAMLALGRVWTARTAVEQNEFVALFADLLERSFVWRLAGKATVSGGVKVGYVGETVDGDTATVDTAVAARDGNDLRLQFRMVQRAGRWVVRDVVMDGVSTMENYHAQFQRLVRDGSWRDLMGQLRAKLGAPPAGVQVAAAAPAERPVSSPPAPDVGPTAPAGQARRPEAEPAPTAPAPTVPTASSIVPRPDPGPQIHASGAPTAGRRRDVATVVAAATNRGADLTGSPRSLSVVPVSVPPIPVQPPRPAAPRARATPAVWIQVGAFKSATAAGRVAAQVEGEILVVAAPGEAGQPAGPLLRVRVGPFADRTEAAARLREIQSLGYRPFLASE